MAKIKRQIIRIDEAKCDGCGACVPSCKEGALRIIEGKAKLVSEIYCDGLGACLGDCPTGALTIEEREAEGFDEAAVEEKNKQESVVKPLGCGCPGSMARELEGSALKQWPIQLGLIPVMAPYLRSADLVLLADCTAVAYANLHRDFLKDRIVAMACPKLDKTEPYIEKLAHMMKMNNFKSIEVVMMEVPCCHGLSYIAEQARQEAGVDVEIAKTIITVEGERRDV